MITDLNTFACCFSARIEQKDDRYIVEIPADEIQHGTLDLDDIYQVRFHTSLQNRSSRQSPYEESNPPVSRGDTRRVEIEHLGDEGNGITRLEDGYVVIVPDTEPGDMVQIELTDVNPNVGFADVIEDENETDSDIE